MDRRLSAWREVKKRTARSHIPPTLLLLALNLAICWRLFKVEYTISFSSIEGFFIGIARYISTHWGDFSWWPLWHCGMPYQNTYVPLLHLIVAATAALAHLPPARAYHAVIGMTYALGPPALYLMAVRLGAARGAAFLSALFYSLFSPSALLLPSMARDIGGWWYARRLQVLTVYGEGPHISAMTLLPIAILALENALRSRNRRSLAAAAIAIALVFLTNVPGTMALGLAVFCWICAQSRGSRAAAWALAALASALAYAVASFGIPPSSLLAVGGTLAPMHPGFSNSLRYGPLPQALALSVTAAAGYALPRTHLPLVVRFAGLYFLLLALLVATARAETFELLPQAHRLHLEMEMAACLLLGSAGWMVYGWIPGWIRPVFLAIAFALVATQFTHYRASARAVIKSADLSRRSEYTTARWLDANMRGGRVYAVGSTQFWLNAFTGTPQLAGCCEQNLSMPVLSVVPYFISHAVGPADTQAAKTWLQALGVQALVVNGPESTDEYKDIQQPERFEKILPLLHREQGDAVYAVFSEHRSLAHAVRPEDLAPPRPSGQPEYAAVARYAARIAGDWPPSASFEWRRGGVARIRARLAPHDLVSVQVAWFPGWQAFMNGQRRSVRSDGLGLVVIDPQCAGNCEISLRWTGPPDLWFTAALSGATLGLLAWLLWKGGHQRYGAGHLPNSSPAG
jgi:hypothetical protein